MSYCLTTAAIGGALLLFAFAGTVQADVVAGSTGTMTINSPYSANGATAQLWGYYTNTSGQWVDTTYGTGTILDGVATFNYTVPANYKPGSNSFYWNTIAYASGSSGAESVYCNDSGAWYQFFTANPNGQTVSQDVYSFDQFSISQNSASFRASANGGTVFPNPYTSGYVSVEVPWTGTMAQFTSSNTATSNYYTNSKTALDPTYLASKGYDIDVLQYTGSNPSQLNQFEQILVHNADYSYSVDLFAFKVASTDDPDGYIYDATLVPAVNTASSTYNPATGAFNFGFASPLSTSTMYFISPGLDEYTSATSAVESWVYNSNGSDLITSGVTVPEPGTLALLAAGALAGLALVWRRRTGK
jgi:hypothetical protein